jgi:hypothetical protein
MGTYDVCIERFWNVSKWSFGEVSSARDYGSNTTAQILIGMCSHGVELCLSL